MIRHYFNAALSGQIVFAAAVLPEAAEEATKTAKDRGASEVVYFGNSVIRNF